MSKKSTTEEFIEKAKLVHGNLYDYSLVDYIYSNIKVKIICSIHGEFEQTPNIHLRESGCRKCADDLLRVSRVSSTEQFIEQAKSVHGDRYDYSLVDYKNSKIDVKIICLVHGINSQRPNNHLFGKGCKFCASINRGNNNCLTEDQFIEQAKSVHGDRYDYSLVDYITSRTKVKIVCKIHGVFYQTPNAHLRKQSCKKCSNNGISKAEKEILDFIKLNYQDTILENNRTVISPFELDIILPDLKIAIEYCGLYWHSHIYKKKYYHLNKLNLCNEAGYRLITIFEDEWIHKQNIVKSKLLNIIGKSTQERIYARKCVIKEILPKEKGEFFKKYHIQGSHAASISLGLYYEDELVSALTFIKKKDGVYDLSRFASSCNVVGGFSKLLTYFKRNYKWKEIFTFADLRWSDGNLYLKNGFEHVYNSSPNYFYFYESTIVRYSRVKFQKHKLHKLLEIFDPIKTEYQNTETNNIYRIYDCGNMKFLLTKK